MSQLVGSQEKLVGLLNSGMPNQTHQKRGVGKGWIVTGENTNLSYRVLLCHFEEAQNANIYLLMFFVCKYEYEI